MNKQQITYVDNKPHIKCGVVILPTTDKSAPLSINQGYLVREFYNSISKSLHHLYITSDEEIKEGDWYYFKSDWTEHVAKAGNPNLPGLVSIPWKGNKQFNEIHDIICKKIIATTDTSLTTIGLDSFSGKPNTLPQPSQQFIEEYIKEYNKRHQITEVLIEVEELKTCIKCGAKMSSHYLSCQYPVCEGTLIQELKLDSQNQITIRKQKDSWSREEVIDLISDWTKMKSGLNMNLSNNFNQWIEENL